MSMSTCALKRFRKLLPLGAGVVLLIATGCSGINASRSFSPLDFILPGLLKNQDTNAVPQSIVGNQKTSSGSSVSDRT
jgi:hypothetical protein